MCSINTWAAKVSVQPHTLYSLQQPRICTPVQQRTGVSPPLSQHTHHSVDQSPWRGQQHSACPWPGPQLWSRINNKLYLLSRSDIVIIVGTRLGPDICSSSPESRGEIKLLFDLGLNHRDLDCCVSSQPPAAGRGWGWDIRHSIGEQAFITWLNH